MSLPHTGNKLSQVCYFYLASINGSSSEVIQVINCTSPSIIIPVPEEDMELSCFFYRNMTATESRHFKNTSSWRIFTCWIDLVTDHETYHVDKETIALLLDHKMKKPLCHKCTEVA